MNAHHYTQIQLEGEDGEEVFEFKDGDLLTHTFIEEVTNTHLEEGVSDVYATYEAWAGSEEWHVKKGEKACFFKDGKAFFHQSQVAENESPDPFGDDDFSDPHDYFGNPGKDPMGSPDFEDFGNDPMGPRS